MAFPNDFAKLTPLLKNGEELERPLSLKGTSFIVKLGKDDKGRYNVHIYRKIKDEPVVFHQLLRLRNERLLNAAWQSFLYDDLDDLLKKSS